MSLAPMNLRSVPKVYEVLKLLEKISAGGYGLVARPTAHEAAQRLYLRWCRDGQAEYLETISTLTTYEKSVLDIYLLNKDQYDGVTL